MDEKEQLDVVGAEDRFSPLFSNLSTDIRVTNSYAGVHLDCLETMLEDAFDKERQSLAEIAQCAVQTGLVSSLVEYFIANVGEGGQGDRPGRGRHGQDDDDDEVGAVMFENMTSQKEARTNMASTLRILTW
jgi:hypothetical protein